MNYQARSEDKVLCDIKSAGMNFIAYRVADMLSRTNELGERSVEKKQLIHEYYTYQTGYYDSDQAGTQIRVNATIRIIRADKVLFSLEQIINSTDPRVLPVAKERAAQTVTQINNGELICICNE